MHIHLTPQRPGSSTTPPVVPVHTLPPYDHRLDDGTRVRCRLRTVITDRVYVTIVEVARPPHVTDPERMEAMRAAILFYAREFPRLHVWAMGSLNFDRTGLVDG